uniref:hypothetical protein n=1 Tax=Aeromonas enteropelogenes TaxID=29489 RepID=UPI003B9FE6B0
GPRNPSRSKKRLLKTALRDNYLEKRRLPQMTGVTKGLPPDRHDKSDEVDTGSQRRITLPL